MISFKLYCKEKFRMKSILKDILSELEHKDYYLNMNTLCNNKPAIHLQWFKEKAPIQIH